MKKCNRCDETKAEDHFYFANRATGRRQNHCKTCQKARSRESALKEPEETRKYMRSYHLEKKYGITHSDYVALLEEQDGRCAICNTDDPEGRYGIFHVDHDHDTGAVRGLLCPACNMGLGKFQDAEALLLRAAEYLQKHK